MVIVLAVGAVPVVNSLPRSGQIAWARFDTADGGRTWSALGTPPAYPMTGLAATPDGKTVYAGAPDGLFRSDDGGRNWAPTGYRGSAFAVATTPDGATVAVVSLETELSRSPDRGATWPAP